MSWRGTLAGAGILLALALSACPRDRSAPDDQEADDRLVVGRIRTELHVFGADGEPMKTSASLESLVRGELAKAKALHAEEQEGSGRGKAARLRVRAMVSPDGASGDLHAIVTARLDQTGSIPLNADIDAVRPGAPEGGQLDAKVYEAHLEKAVRDTIKALDAQVSLLRGGSGALIKALREDEPSIRISAARELGERRARDAVEPMCELLEEERGPVGEAVIGALAAIGDERGVPCIIHWAGTDDRRTLIALEPLAAIGGQEAQAYVEMVASGHENAGIRRVAEAAMERLRSKRPPTKSP